MSEEECMILISELDSAKINSPIPHADKVKDRLKVSKKVLADAEEFRKEVAKALNSAIELGSHQCDVGAQTLAPAGVAIVLSELKEKGFIMQQNPQNGRFIIAAPID
jgi:hypothetical protein